MAETIPPHIQELAKTALKQAEEHCHFLRVDPTPHLQLLADLVIKEIAVAAEDIARDRLAGGPAIAYALNQPFWRNVYFADASRRGAEALAWHLSSSSSPVTPFTET